VHVVATAGHVDHGKSTLVRALTGTDPDRLAEEKARGLTIDLGFAGGTLPSGHRFAVIDVPGHVRFLKNMLAGVGAVDACLFVVAATEGWKPQSEEHLRILDLLGVGHGLVALTKVGLVDDELAEIAAMDVADHVAGSFLADAEVIGVDAPTNRGLDDLRAGLDRLLAATPTAVDHDRPRLWVDRSFAAKGTGTVVTGTLAGGSLRLDDELVVEPEGRGPVRVRRLQRLGVDEQRVGPGNRVAVNLVGIDRHQVARGDALVRAGQWHRATTLDVRLQALDALDHPVSRRGAYLAYIGSGEHAVAVRVLGPTTIEPGDQGAMRLHLPQALPLVPGDRFVLREAGRGETVGGGEVLDVDPVVPAARARPDRSVDRVVAERGWVDVDDLTRLTGEVRPADVGCWVVDPAALAAAERRIGSAVGDAGELGLDVAALDDRDRAVLERLTGVVVERGRARLAAARDALADHPFLAALEASPFNPPPSDSVDPPLMRQLVARGLVVERDGIHFSPLAVARAADTAARLLGDHPEGFTVAQAREALGTSRKWAIPLLAHLDATGVTRRRGDVRIAGPRLPATPPA